MPGPCETSKAVSVPAIGYPSSVPRVPGRSTLYAATDRTKPGPYSCRPYFSRTDVSKRRSRIRPTYTPLLLSKRRPCTSDDLRSFSKGKRENISRNERHVSILPWEMFAYTSSTAGPVPTVSEQRRAQRTLICPMMEELQRLYEDDPRRPQKDYTMRY